MTYLSDHVLYSSKTCPYCIRVLNYMEKAGITMDVRDVSYPGVREDLIRIGGKRQVPCLVIRGKVLYESDDIIAYLREKVPACDSQ